MSNIAENLIKILEKKKGKKVNPWAVCHASTGPEKSDKFERCVMDVKKKEGIEEATGKEMKISQLAIGKRKQTPHDLKAAKKGIKKTTNPSPEKALNRMFGIKEAIMERIEANREKVRQLKKSDPNKFKPASSIQRHSTAGLTQSKDPSVRTAVKNIHQGRAERAKKEAQKRPLKDI